LKNNSNSPFPLFSPKAKERKKEKRKEKKRKKESDIKKK